MKTARSQSCQDVTALLSAYAAAQLSDAETGAVQDHVSACRACRADLKRIQTLGGLMSHTDPHVAVKTGAWVAAAMDSSGGDGESELDEIPATAWSGKLGSAPWWCVSLSLHLLLVALAGVVSMAIALPTHDDAVIMITELQARPVIENPETEKPKDNASALESKLETAATDPTSKEASDVTVPPDILAKAELGDHFETINPELPDTHSALGNPDAKMFHSVEGNTDAAGGGGSGGVGMEDLIGVGGSASRGSGGGFGGGDGTGVGVQSGSGKGSFGNRNGGGRKIMVKRHGGSAATESAVDKALTWLAYHQEADGHWDIKKYGARELQGANAYDEGVTGLCLLAFLGAGHTERVGAHKDNVLRAAKWLMSKQLPDGNFGPFEGKGNYDYHIYDTALDTLALAELYGMTRDSEFRKEVGASAQKGIDSLYKAQQATAGGWYHGHNNRWSSMSVTGWVIMAMKSAKVAKLKVPAQMFEGAIKSLDASADKDAAGYYTRVGYTDEPNSKYRYAYHDAYTTSAIGMVCLEFTGQQNATEQLGAYLIKVLPKWEKPDTSFSTEPQNFYHWYYTTLAMFQLGGEKWTKWNEALKTTLVPNQCKDGDNAGSWPAERAWETTGGRVFTTAMGALALEVYYRYEKLSH